MLTELSIIATPAKIQALDEIYADIPLKGKKNQPLAFIVQSLVEIARQKILKIINASSLRFKVPHCICAYVTAGIFVNGKFCPLQYSDLDKTALNNLKIEISPDKQLEVFQRLINERRLYMRDLEIAGIHVSILNQIKLPNNPQYTRFDEVMLKIAKVIQSQYKKEQFKLAYEPYIGSDELNFWLNMV